MGGATYPPVGYQPSRSTPSRISRQRCSEVAQAITAAPYACISVFIVSGTEASVKITQGRPARAAYAAVEAPWLPVEEMVITRAPLATAWLTATEQSRSLYDHVGFRLSSLANRRGKPSRLPSRSRGTSGVAPSPRLTACSAAT